MPVAVATGFDSFGERLRLLKAVHALPFEGQPIVIKIPAGEIVEISDPPNSPVEQTMDSLDAVELLMALEEVSGVEIADEEAEKVTAALACITWNGGRYWANQRELLTNSERLR